MLCPQCNQQNPSGARFCNGCSTELPGPHASVVRDSASRVTVSRDFVGRQREIGELVSALDEAIAGRGRLVMLAGEPGIGKTRTAQELAAIAEHRGVQVLWGRCHEGEGAPPYWPWIQAIREYAGYREPERLLSEMGPGAAAIAEIVSAVGEKLPDLEPTPVLGPEQAHFRLFDSITNFLRNASRTQPLVLVLDDLHWADRPSLLLLEFLAREISQSRLLVLGTYRDAGLARGHPLSRTLGELTREHIFQRMVLQGLDREDVGKFIEISAHSIPQSDVVETIYGRTEGNPLFLAELVRLVRQEGELTQDGLASVGMPEGIREVIGRRLGRLSAECNRALTIAAVIGREFGLDQVDQLSDDLSGDEVLEVVEEALAGGVIEEVEGVVGRHQFSHTLIRQTLVSELSTTRRVRLHARIVEALEELYGADAEAHASELAYHSTEAEAVGGSERLVRYSRLAGEQALARYAWEDAAAHFQRALKAKEGTSTATPTVQAGPARDADTAALLLGLGRAQSFADRWEEALKSLARALDYFEEVGDVASAVATATCSVPPAAWSDFFPIVARVIQMVPPESHEAGRMLSRYGALVANVESDYQAAQGAFSRALAIARKERDASLEMRTLQGASFAYLQALNRNESLTKAIEAIRRAPQADNPMVESLAHHHAATALLCMGDLGRARVHAANSLPPAERFRQALTMSWALQINEQVASAAGEWDAARGFSDRHLALDSTVMEEQLASRALLEYQTGDLAQCESYIERLDGSRNRRAPPRVTDRADRLWLVDLARISGATGHLDVVKAVAEAILSSPRVSPIFTRAARVALALTAIQEGDDALSAELYTALEPFRSTLDTDGLMSLDRLLGLLAYTMGELDDAASHFEGALAFCRNAGYRPELAWTCHDYAALRLAQREQEKAIELLDESLAISTELGMRLLTERVGVLREQVESVPAKAPAYPDGLTAREVEVLRLVAAGKTNRDIAEELVISLNTVLRHVSNIFGKTGSANRADATMYAARKGLASLAD